jgi:hypothetical protein
MAKFKVGDRVRCKTTYIGQFTAGKEYTVRSVTDSTIEITEDDRGSTTNGWGMEHFDLVPAFKVGDRVRFVEKYGRAKAGDEGVITGFWSDGVKVDVNGIAHSCFASRVEPVAVAASNSNAKFKVGDMITKRIPGWKEEGYRVTKIDATKIWVDPDNGSNPVRYDLPDDFVLVAPASLTIRAGAYYKTRDGRKALVGNNKRDATYPFYHEVDGKLWHGVTREGKSCLGERNCDLIAEWVDEPTATAAAGPASNDNAKPKFKVGDAIRHKSLGYVGVVTEIVDAYTIKTHWTGKGWGGKDPVDSIELIAPVAPASTTPAIVCLIENGQPKPADSPFVHPNKDAATKEAARLAGKHPGKEFGVYELVATKKEAKVYDHEWQRLAVAGRKIEAIKELRAVSGLYLKSAKDAVEGWLEREAA